MTTESRPVFYADTEFMTIELIDGWEHDELCHNVIVRTTNLRQNSHGITADLDIYHNSEEPVKSGITLNLNDYQARTKLAKTLASDFTDLLPWGEILEYVVHETLRRYRSIGLPDDMDTAPEIRCIEYAVEKLLPRNLPTTIYAPGGRGKSIFADFLAVLYQYGLTAPGGLPFISRQGNVLYLDYEAELELHRRYIEAIKAGMGISEHRQMRYLNCDTPITAIISELRDLVKTDDIELVIIDSQMAATAGGLKGITDAQIASEYYNCLHSLHCTTLTIDHVSKDAMKFGDTTSSPYGSVVKYNRARSLYELRSQQEVESDHMELALVHHKFNLGKRQSSLGIAIDFYNNDQEELEKIEFSSCNLADNPLLEKSQSYKQRLINALRDIGKGTTKELAEYLEAPQDAVRVNLNRYADTFVKLSKTEWGLLV